MKKSQSIFLLSGLVPLVAAPIAIVASCSNDTAATTTFALKNDITLTGLQQAELDPNQYVNDKPKLINLIVAKKDQVFNNPPADLVAAQIEIVGDVTADAAAGTLSFKLKVKTTGQNPTDLIPESSVVLKGFTKTSP